METFRSTENKFLDKHWYDSAAKLLGLDEWPAHFEDGKWGEVNKESEEIPIRPSTPDSSPTMGVASTENTPRSDNTTSPNNTPDLDETVPTDNTPTLGETSPGQDPP